MASNSGPERLAKPSREDLQVALRAASRFRQRSYVTGLSIGEPSKTGRVLEDELAVCIHVREKFPMELLRKNQVFPSHVHGVRLDVDQRNFRPRELPAEEILLRRLLPAHPAMPGVQISVENGGAGTFGLLVYDRVDGKACLLGSAHVMRGGARTTVYQPGWDNEAEPIGSVRRTLWDKYGDATIAAADRHRTLDSQPYLGAAVTGARRVQQGDILEKSGATTGVTRAQVSKIGCWNVDYDAHASIMMQGFELRPIDPTDISEISDGGDSGSVWYDPGTGEAVGMTVAGDFGPVDRDEWTFCCHLDTAFKKLMISLDPTDRLS